MALQSLSLPAPPSKDYEVAGGGGNDNNVDNEDYYDQEPLPGSRSREERRWKPKKTEQKNWMTGEKSWRYANVHADKMKAKGNKTDPDDYKPKTIKMR